MERPKNIKSNFSAELPDEDAAIELAERLAARLGKSVTVYDRRGIEICVAPPKPHLNS